MQQLPSESKKTVRQRFMEEIYPDRWIKARKEKYGFSEYDRKMCEIIIHLSEPGDRVLEVGIGSGYPLASFMSEQGRKVYGIDIAPKMIEVCHRDFPAIEAMVGKAESLQFPDAYFSVTYCLHSMWYLGDMFRAIEEMIRVTMPRGRVFFDMMNPTNKRVIALKRKTKWGGTIGAPLVLLKRMLVEGKRPTLLALHNSHTLASHEQLSQFLHQKNNITYYVATGDNLNFLNDQGGTYSDSARLVYMVIPN